MQSLLDTNLGVFEVKCPWCGPRPFGVEFIVTEKSIPEMFHIIKNGYERVLYLQHWDAKRIHEETKLRQSVIIKSREIPAAPRPAPPCSGVIEPAKVSESCPCSGDDNHCLA
jgi:hypothetical protein